MTHPTSFHLVKIIGGPRFQNGLFYLAPEPIQIGTWVSVPISNKNYPGVVIQSYSNQSALDQLESLNIEFKKLKNINSILSERPVLSENHIQLLNWMAQYTHSEHSKTWATAFPKEWLKREFLIPPKKKKNKDLDSNLNSKKIKPNLFTLNSDQQSAVDQVILNQFKVYLLMGVTGSGKSEVYLHLAQKVLEQKKQILILVPEIGLTGNLLNRFKSRLTQSIAVFHSQLTPLARAREALKVNNHKINIILGTRSAVFIPTDNLGLIIIDESHDLSYKQQSSLRYHARDIAIKRAQLNQIPIILGTATPSLESFYNAQNNRFKLLKLNTVFHSDGNKEVNLIDLRRTHIESGLSQLLITEIKKALESTPKKQILLFLNRRGYSPVLMCHHCGWSAKCSGCEVYYTVHHSPKHLHCHHCQHQQTIPTQCPSCEKSDFIYPGTGTEKLEAYLSELFPDKSIARIDRSSMDQKSKLTDQLDLIHSGKIDIIIGTQMIAKGHHFKHLGLVGIVDMDTGLYSGDFRALERTAQLLVQISGRVGRENFGQVFIQTHQPEHPFLTEVLSQPYETILNHLLNTRKSAQLPPYYYLAQIRVESASQKMGLDFLNQIKHYSQNILTQSKNINNNTTELLGPAPAASPKRAHWYRQYLLLAANNRTDLHHVLNIIQSQLPKRPTAKLRVAIDVDPQEVV